VPGLLAIALALLISLAPPQKQRTDALVNEWCTQRDLVLVDAAQRHYDVALWCWKVGLRQQATSAVLESLSVSDGRFRPAKSTLAKMRALDDADWLKDVPRPSPTVLRDHAKRVARAKEQNRRDHLRLAQWAAGKGLDDEARAVYERLLQREGAPLLLDPQGCLHIGNTVVRPDFSRTIYDAAVDINGRRYLRDEFLRALPDVGSIFETGSDELRVRSTLSRENAEHLHQLGLALVPLLEAELGGRPGERMELFVFARRASYDSYLVSAGLTRFQHGSGVADRKTYTAAVCAEGTDLDALALHELTHLFQYGISRATMPDWYSEGLAETFGGQGTFRWNGKELEVRGLLTPERRALLDGGAKLLPMAEFLGSDAASLFPDRGWLFYAQAWAFVRFLRSEAGAETGDRYRRWERTCNGAALGADEADLRARDPSAARELFEATFAPDLGSLEQRFREYVASLK
jgi:hypothetical protein